MPQQARKTGLGKRYLGRYLKELRETSGLTLRQVESLSRSFGEPVAFDYLSRAESGRILPSAHKLISLSHVYEVPAQSFLDTIELGQFEAFAPATRRPEECQELGLAAARRGDYAKAYACFLRGIRLLEESRKEEPAQREQLLRMRSALAIALTQLGKLRLAEQQIGLVLQERSASDHVSSRALNALAVIDYELDRLSLSEGVAWASLQVARRAGDKGQIARSLISLANARFDLGRVRAAATVYRRALRLVEHCENTNDIITLHYNLGNCYDKLEQFREAEESYQRGLELAERGLNPRFKARGLMDLGRCQFHQGRHDEARSILMQSRAIGMTHDYRSETFHSSYYLWRIALEQRVGSEAVELFRALKRLRMRVDQRSEEVVSFDAYLTEVRSRKRRQGGHDADDPEARSSPSSPPPARDPE